MVEVHSGSKPGRPVALLIVTSIVLIGALGLAWVQVRESRALGPEQSIPGTPLLVRPPLGWLADRKDPRSFVLPVRRAVRGQEQWEVDRRIRFNYDRLGRFQPPVEWLRAAVGSRDFEPEPAKIGPFAAVQIRQVERRRRGRHIFVGESILRVAVLPGGEVIAVTYIPMTELTPADLRLLDTVCNSIRLSEPGLSAAPEEALQHAGVDFAFEDGWQASLPYLREVPGFFVEGLEDGFPAWSLGVFRTWLAAGREPSDLLYDFASSVWLLPEERVEVRSWQRGNGVALAAVRHPDQARNRHTVAGAWVVKKSASEAVMLFVFTNERHVDAAYAAAERIAGQIDIRPDERIPDVAAAETAGAELAARLTASGALSWWGELAAQFRYTGETLHGEGFLGIGREPIGRNPVRGYRGELHRRVKGSVDEHATWEVGRRATSYRYVVETALSDGLTIKVREQRGPREDIVTRVVTLGESESRNHAFRPGPSYICPPIESIAEAQVARGTSACLSESATLLGRGAHTRLLRPLPPGKDGHPRTFVQDDFWPFGAILGFDENDELQYHVEATLRYNRILDDRRR